MSKVLIVDDDDDIREAVRDLLEGEHIPVATASNGREALDYLLNEERPCLVLLDLMMPVMNGWELLWAMKEHRPLNNIPVVVVSAAIGDARTEGVRFLKKPIRFDSLLAAIREYCPVPT